MKEEIIAIFDNEYVRLTSDNRLYINNTLGCKADCSYCYLPKIGYLKGEDKPLPFYFLKVILKFLWMPMLK